MGFANQLDMGSEINSWIRPEHLEDWRFISQDIESGGWSRFRCLGKKIWCWKKEARELIEHAELSQRLITECNWAEEEWYNNGGLGQCRDSRTKDCRCYWGCGVVGVKTGWVINLMNMNYGSLKPKSLLEASSWYPNIFISILTLVNLDSLKCFKDYMVF